jgi:hypothetical protein
VARQVRPIRGTPLRPDASESGLFGIAAVRYGACCEQSVKISLKRSSRSRGSVLVEAGLAIPVIVVLMLGVLDFARVHHTRSRLQNAVSQATRFAITGNRLSDEDNPGFYLTREDSILKLVKRVSGFRDIPASAVEIFTVNPDGSTRSGAGGPGDVVLVTVSYHVDVFTPGLALVFPGSTYRFSCTARFRNEEFVA